MKLLVAHVRNHSAWHPGNVIFDNLDGTFALVSLFRLVEWGQENMLKSGLVLHEPFLGDVQPCFTHSGLVVPTFHRDTPLRYLSLPLQVWDTWNCMAHAWPCQEKAEERVPERHSLREAEFAGILPGVPH
jgi:hypothetical protein